MCSEAVGCRKPEGDSLGLKPVAEFCHLFWPQEREHNLLELRQVQISALLLSDFMTFDKLLKFFDHCFLKQT